jgi:hypothetical protein
MARADPRPPPDSAQLSFLLSKVTKRSDLWGSAHFGTQASVGGASPCTHRDVPATDRRTAEYPRGDRPRTIDLTTQSTPDLDLSPFGAQRKGVSAVIHAAFERGVPTDR